MQSNQIFILSFINEIFVCLIFYLKYFNHNHYNLSAYNIPNYMTDYSRLLHFRSLLIIAICLLHIKCASGVLKNFPIIFQMSGSTTYTPDSGGVTRNGYKLRIGFTNFQWIAAEIITNTDKNDVLVVQVNEFYTQGSTPLRTGHQISVTDYYRTGDILNNDQNNQYDISSYNYVQNKDYYIDLVRYMGSNSGQDWNAAANGYSLLQVCFYSNEKTLFSVDSWTNGLKQCYFFQIDNYLSEFKGENLKNFYINGYKTGIYGWIDGPYVSNNLFFYQEVPLFSYTKQPALVIQIGTTNGNVGQDFNVHSPISSEAGDYYGASVTNIMKDNSNAGGFENSGLFLKHWNAVPASQNSAIPFTALRIDYKRNISTFDAYDRQLKSTFVFCMYLYSLGTINSDLTDKSCQVVELTYHYPRMSMPIRQWESFLNIKGYIMFALIILLLNN